jgi:hypothetical protein
VEDVRQYSMLSDMVDRYGWTRCYPGLDNLDKEGSAKIQGVVLHKNLGIRNTIGHNF